MDFRHFLLFVVVFGRTLRICRRKQFKQDVGKDYFWWQKPYKPLYFLVFLYVYRAGQGKISVRPRITHRTRYLEWRSHIVWLFLLCKSRVYSNITIIEALIFVKLEFEYILFYTMQHKSLNLFLHFTIDIWVHMSYYINIQIYNYITFRRVVIIWIYPMSEYHL